MSVLGDILNGLHAVIPEKRPMTDAPANGNNDKSTARFDNMELFNQAGPHRVAVFASAGGKVVFITLQIRP
ncbi:MAG: hypothetical protein U0694_00610 [Anaerolineae bacterium]